MLNTFFFGYLALKWRRLVRVLIILGFIGWIFFPLQIVEREAVDNKFLFVFFVSLIPVIPVALISWVVKPFIVKD